MKIIYAVIIAVAVINAPGAGKCVGPISCRQGIVVAEGETIIMEMIGFIIAGINEGGDLPCTGFHRVLNTRGGVIIGRIVF